jgi:L-aminopeptidase/D-esterase-like protein
MQLHNTLTDIPGILVGHAQDETALTGCTVILCQAGAVGGVDQRGGAPGTRETDLLRPLHLVEQVHAVLLSGGSAFGLEAASGVMRYLEERGVGYETGVARVPIVPAAILFDLAIGRADIRPDADMGYQACLNASSQPVPEGNVGVGAGATVGKILGISQAMKSGVGTACLQVAPGLLVGALVVVNALGDIIDPSTGLILAGARLPGSQDLSPGEPGYFADTLAMLPNLFGGDGSVSPLGQNTTLGVVATNARLSKEQANLVAQMAHDGLARSIRPIHTLWDGDTLFALATGEVNADFNLTNVSLTNVSLVGAFAAEVVAQAVIRAVRSARPVAGLPSLCA